jgi:hypothetical protein
MLVIPDFGHFLEAMVRQGTVLASLAFSSQFRG